jgi:putative endonuclease
MTAFWMVGVIAFSCESQPEFLAKKRIFMAKSFYVYLLASAPFGTLYIGVTSDLIQRVWQHKEGLVDGFTKKYGIKDLVWYEIYDDAANAIMREKQLKKWHRDWKVNLIQQGNPDWKDLYVGLLG